MRSFSLGALILLTACAPSKPLSPEEIERKCLEARADAIAPQRRAEIGADSDDGPYIGFEFSFSADYLRGTDPEVVYRQCKSRLNAKNAEILAARQAASYAQ